jgi:hypothetical protein
MTAPHELPAASTGAEKIVEAFEHALTPTELALHIPGQPECPVGVLGHRDGYVYLLTPSGELRWLRRSELRKLQILDLFDGDVTWLRKAAPNGSGGWSPDTAAQIIVQMSTAAGIFDLGKSARGTGIWTIRAGNARSPQLLVHCGDVILAPSKLVGELRRLNIPAPEGHSWIRAGVRIGRHIYPAYPAEDRPDFSEAARQSGLEAAHDLEDLFECWSWKILAGARILIGAIAAAWLAGAIMWRPHLWISGDRGTGKSTLLKLIVATLSDTAFGATDPTAAGLRQALGPNARALIVDEVEQSEHHSRPREVIELARIASTEGQAPVLRGSSSHIAASFHVRALFIAASINRPNMAPQDLERWTVLDLAVLDDHTVDPIDLEDAIDNIIEFAPAIRARAIIGFERFQHNLKVVKRATSKLELKIRVGDQIGTLVAAAETLLSDEELNEETALERLRALQMDQELLEIEDERDDVQCLRHLLTANVPLRGHDVLGDRSSIGELIVEAGTSSAALRDLRRFGITRSKHETDVFIVANQHSELERIFERSRWSGGGWVSSLRRVPGAKPTAKSVHFAGGSVRGMRLPISLVSGVIEEQTF